MFVGNQSPLCRGHVRLRVETHANTTIRISRIADRMRTCDRRGTLPPGDHAWIEQALTHTGTEYEVLCA